MHWETILIVIGVLAVLGVLAFFIFRRRAYGPRIHRLPLDLMGYPDMPGVPFVLTEIPGTLVKLGLRANATTQAKWGLDNTYTVQGTAANGYSFLYGRGKDVEASEEADRQDLKTSLEASAEELEITPAKLKARMALHDEPSSGKDEDPLTTLSLTDPLQFTMSWTTFADVYENALPQLDEFAATLTDPEAANRSFWPTIAQHGFAYNLLILQKVNAQSAPGFKAIFGQDWLNDWNDLLAAGLLYAIDLTLYEKLPSNVVKGTVRFTPGTLTLLVQDATTKALSPIAVMVAGQNGAGKQIFTYGLAQPGAWLYALLAAKTSVTLYGIWMGHVYHWHIVSAALLMTLGNHVEENHPLRMFMAPQSDYLIPFNNVLLLLWKNITPPTSVSTAPQFLAMTNDFAKGRTYFDDDPDVTLEKFGIRREDFSEEKDWDRFPIAGMMLDLFAAVGEYVTVFVETTWASDTAVIEDKPLQAWLAASTNPKDGNVVGLPPMDSRANLIKTLRSLVYRLTAHGTARLNSTANPVLTYIPNFPPCLQIQDIPAANAVIDTKTLLSYLPKTGTIGEMITFYFTFVFSAPYVPFLPLAGNEVELIWPGGPSEPRNAALIDLREYVAGFIRVHDQPAQMHQWPRNIET